MIIDWLMEHFRREKDPNKTLQSANACLVGAVIGYTQCENFDGVKNAVETYLKYLEEVNNEHDN